MIHNPISTATICLALGLTLVPVPALHAGITISEITGTWGGAEGGPEFRATLTHTEDEADLKIWNRAVSRPEDSGTPDLFVVGFAPIAFATSQRLEVVPFHDGNLLQLVTEFEDEEADASEIVRIRFADGQFRLVGYHSSVTLHTDVGGRDTIECKIDFTSGKIVELGQERSLPSLTAEDLDAGRWRIGAALDRGWCQH